MSTNTRGKAETAGLKKNIEEQLNRLLAQLQDLEDSKADLDAKEYEEMKADTYSQLSEFQATLEKMLKGDMTLVDEFGSVQLAIQAAVSQAFKTPEVIRMFAQRQPKLLRDRLSAIQREYKLKNISESDYKSAAVEILAALRKLGEQLTPEEAQFMADNMSAAMADFEKADDSLGGLQFRLKGLEQAEIKRG